MWHFLFLKKSLLAIYLFIYCKTEPNIRLFLLKPTWRKCFTALHMEVCFQMFSASNHCACTGTAMATIAVIGSMLRRSTTRKGHRSGIKGGTSGNSWNAVKSVISGSCLNNSFYQTYYTDVIAGVNKGFLVDASGSQPFLSDVRSQSCQMNPSTPFINTLCSKCLHLVSF